MHSGEGNRSPLGWARVGGEMGRTVAHLLAEGGFSKPITRLEAAQRQTARVLGGYRERLTKAQKQHGIDPVETSDWTPDA